MPTVTESLRAFLTAKLRTHNGPDLLERYLRFAPHLETQVNVIPGEPVDGKRSTYTDGIDEWHSIRIPKNPAGEPTFKDYELRFPLDLRADAIGSTGWDWSSRKSRYLGFDFDSLVSHAAGVGISDAELDRVKQAACALPWVEVRRSTSGNGLHLYVMFDDAGVPTENHTIHAALGRAVLGLMSSAAGFDFARHIDCCGSNVWIWARKMTAENQGLALVKAATRTLSATDLPANWRDHVEVITRQRTKIKIEGVPDESLDPFEQLASSRRIVPLDEKHKRIIDELRTGGGSVVWIPDYHLLQTHTVMLAKLMDRKKELGLSGFFKTNSQGKDLGGANCFLFPLDNGAWKVYRFSQGINEAETWEQDGNGWTTCYFNRSPNLKVAARAMGGLEDAEKGGFVFETASKAVEAVKALGRTLPLPEGMDARETRLRASKDGRLVVQIAKEDGDEGMKQKGWQAKKAYWVQIFETKTETKTESFADHSGVRRLKTTTGESAGWKIEDIGREWIQATKDDARSALLASGVGKSEVDVTLGQALKESWTLVKMPFQPEYPGDRRWNFGAAQFAAKPSTDDELSHPYWDSIFDHLGGCLNDAVKSNQWCVEHGIRSGAEWLRLWVAAMIREPFCRLPFLFAHGPEDCGKSIFSEAIRDALLTTGVAEANRPLTNDTGFNGELENAVLAYVEEIDLRTAKQARSRLKQWVTDSQIVIRKMRTDAYSVRSSLHWYMSANSASHLPLSHGDSRCVILHVPPLTKEKKIPKDVLLEKLKAEASHFLGTLLRLNLPPADGRLRIAVVETDDKTRMADDDNPAGKWFRERVTLAETAKVAKAELHADYQTWADENDSPSISRIEFGRRLRDLTGGTIKDGKIADGNSRKDCYVGIALKAA